MIEIKEGAGMIVAGDVRNAVAAVDDALLNGAKLCVSVFEAAGASDLPVTQTQQLYHSITASLNSVLEGRERIASAICQMNAIKLRSNLAPMDYGCPDGWESTAAPFTSAELRYQEEA